MNTKTMTVERAKRAPVTAIQEGVVAAIGALITIGAISATGESLFTVVGKGVDVLSRLIGL